MSEEVAPRTPSLSREPSDPFGLKVIIFECAHGDTILISLPDEKWALIDCHLPSRRVCDRFFELLDSCGISRLEYIFQTHPDFDHFYGMTKVLEYFTCDGRSLGYWCDGGVYAQEVQSLIWPDRVSQKHFAKLQECLDRLGDEGKIQFVELNDRVEATSCKGYEDVIKLTPLGPSARTKRRVTRSDLARLQEDPNAKMEANRLSVILALSIHHNDESWNFLFPGDAGAEEIEGGLEAWCQRLGVDRIGLDTIKLPHHGSLASHSGHLAKMTNAARTKRFAVISAGNRPKLPDRAVIQDYQDNSWCVLATTRKKGEKLAPSRPMTLAGRARHDAVTVVTQNVTITWHSETHLTAGPEAAIISREEIALYETAAG